MTNSKIEVLDTAVKIMYELLKNSMVFPTEKNIILDFFQKDLSYMNCCKTCGSLLIEKEEFVNMNDESKGDTESASNLIWCQGKCQDETNSTSIYEYSIRIIKEVTDGAEENNNS